MSTINTVTVRDLKVLTKKQGQDAAELAFIVTNAPEEALSPAMQRWQRRVFRRFRGPSVSTGDSVDVVPRDGVDLGASFLCLSVGWERRPSTQEDVVLTASRIAGVAAATAHGVDSPLKKRAMALRIVDAAKILVATLRRKESEIWRDSSGAAEYRQINDTAAAYFLSLDQLSSGHPLNRREFLTMLGFGDLKPAPIPVQLSHAGERLAQNAAGLISSAIPRGQEMPSATLLNECIEVARVVTALDGSEEFWFDPNGHVDAWTDLGAWLQNLKGENLAERIRDEDFDAEIEQRLERYTEQGRRRMLIRNSAWIGFLCDNYAISAVEKVTYAAGVLAGIEARPDFSWDRVGLTKADVCKGLAEGLDAHAFDVGGRNALNIDGVRVWLERTMRVPKTSPDEDRAGLYDSKAANAACIALLCAPQAGFAPTLEGATAAEDQATERVIKGCVEAALKLSEVEARPDFEWEDAERDWETVCCRLADDVDAGLPATTNRIEQLIHGAYDVVPQRTRL